MAHATPYKVAQNIFLHMTVRRDAHKKLVREFEHHHDSLMGELLQLQQNVAWRSVSVCVSATHRRVRAILKTKESRGRAISSHFGTHLIPNLPHQNECDDADKCALRRLYPSEIAQNDDDHQRELPR